MVPVMLYSQETALRSLVFPFIILTLQSRGGSSGGWSGITGFSFCTKTRGGAPGLWKKHWTCFEIQLTICVSRDTSLHFSGPQCFSFMRLEGGGWIREILRSPPALLGF